MSNPATFQLIQDFQTQKVQEERIPLQISKLKANTLVIARPVKLIWERNRPCHILATLETSDNASTLLGTELVGDAENRGAGMFDKHYGQGNSSGSARFSSGMYALSNYHCGPLRFHFNRSMLILGNSFELHDSELLNKAKFLRILFKP